MQPTIARNRLASLTSHLSRTSISASPTRLAAPPPSLTSRSMVSSSPAAASEPPKANFDLSPVNKDPLGGGKFVKTAGCIIIGDEVLNGKTKDSNSNFMAKLCFDLGIELRRIEVIADDVDEIVEAARRMTDKYDWVVTSGGIGPTHDDITYESIATAFDALPLQYDDETLRRMAELMKRRANYGEQTEEMVTARKRMALFPSKDVEIIFPTSELWVPVVRMRGKLCILPGVPRLFEALLLGLEKYIPLDPNRPMLYRHLVHTPMPESSIAPFLTSLSKRVADEGIKVGSYPKWGTGVEVSLIGNDLSVLERYGQEVVSELKGSVVSSGQVGKEVSKSS